VQRRYWLLVLVLASMSGALARYAVMPDRGAAQEMLPPPTLRTPEYIGAGSCSASACHNSSFTHRQTGSEYGFWITRDPHARAYEVLFEKRSVDIQKKLDRRTRAQEDHRCLQCHVAPGYDDRHPPPQAKHFKTDGVSCESCHGPAREWINAHHLDAWQLRTPDEKKRLGMRDTRSLVGRARVCVTCHVGAPSMDVNHDLIAAGHPRLHFEFAAFHAHLPRHWSDSKDRRSRPDFEAQAWAIGRLTTAMAELELLAARAEPQQKVWPEFAEHSCTACHHDLAGRAADLKNRKLGLGLWHHSVDLTEVVVRSLNADGDEQLFDALRAIRASFDSAKPDRAALMRHAAIAVHRLDPWLREMERRRLDSSWMEQLSRHALKVESRTLEEATDRVLAVTAITRAHRDQGLSNLDDDQYDHFQKLSRRLSRAISFEPAAVRERMRRFP
jgi:hypothetical protein